jgi:hypothetical protein
MGLVGYDARLIVAYSVRRAMRHTTYFFNEVPSLRRWAGGYS